MPTLSERLLALERSLLSHETRSNAKHLSRTIAAEFLEFGASGRSYGKREALRWLPRERPRRFVVDRFKIRVLARGCALATYRLREDKRVSLRSSIWVLRRGAWRLAFHQGTRAARRLVPAPVRR